MQQVYADVKNAGGELIVITPQKPEHSRKMIEEHGLEFPMLQDEDLKLADKLGLTHTLPDDLKEIYLQFDIDLAKANGNDSWQLPMPARYLVDSEQLIRDAAVNPDYTIRPEPGDMVDLLKMLS